MGIQIGINQCIDTVYGVFSSERMAVAANVVASPESPIKALTKCLEKGAQALGFQVVRDMLRQTEKVKILLPFLVHDILARRSGPKLGLILTRGYEGGCTSAGDQGKEALRAIISMDMVVGIDEEVDESGGQVRAPDEEKVRNSVRTLLEQGAEALVVSLRHSPLNPDNERAVKRIFEMEYPSHYLGAVPLVLSSEISASLDDALRTNTTLLNTYCHKDTARFLYAAEDALKRLGYPRSLLVMHSDGGVARACKSIPIRCMGSHIASDILGINQMAAILGLQKVVGLHIDEDLTWFVKVNGMKGPYRNHTLVEGLPIDLPFPEFISIGRGVSSRVVVENGALQVVLEKSTSASDGTEKKTPAVKDALLALGFVDQDSDGEGRKELGGKHADQVIEEALARPLGVSVEKAAHEAVSSFARALASAIDGPKGQGQQNKEATTLVALGTWSGLLCCYIAEHLGISRIYCPPFSGAFSAFGGLLAPISHSYEICGGKAIHKKIETGEREWFKNRVRDLRDSAIRDMMGEGLVPDNLSFQLSLVVASGDQKQIKEIPLGLESEDPIGALFEQFSPHSKEPTQPEELMIHLFRFRVVAKTRGYEPLKQQSDGSTPQKVCAGTKKIYTEHGFSEVNLYRREELRCGSVVKGPALIVNGEDTVFVKSGKSYHVDEFLGARII